MDQSYPCITLKAGKEKSILHKHPWIFSGAVSHGEKELSEGDRVYVTDHKGHYLATGHFHKGTILVRCFDFNDHKIDQQFWNNKIKQALTLRERLGLTNSTSTNCYRLVHGEGDGLPGLIIDIYNRTAVLQTFTMGMHFEKSFITAAIAEVMKDNIDAIFDKSAESMLKQSGTAVQDGFLYKKEKESTGEYVLENGLKFYIDFISGQKTGFFIDQRENRELLGSFCKNKTVLNTFCYTGGFSIYAAASGASKVISVDSSKKAIDTVNQNFALNFESFNHESVTGEVMPYLKTAENCDVLILDPPAYAKHLSHLKNAMVGYRNLNTEGLKKIKPGGILFTFSCSQAVDRELFRKLVFQSAIQAQRNIKILYHLSQPADHPVSIYHPEGEYLKGLVLYVE